MPESAGLDDTWPALRNELHRRLRIIIITPRQRQAVTWFLAGATLVCIGAALSPPIGPSAVRKMLGVIGDLLRSIDDAGLEDDSPDVNELIENRPASDSYEKPRRSFCKSPWRRPDRKIRTAARQVAWKKTAP